MNSYPFFLILLSGESDLVMGVNSFSFLPLDFDLEFALMNFLSKFCSGGLAKIMKI
jgi:hypothetical protein